MTLHWERATDAGIVRDDSVGAYHAGRTVDLIPLAAGGVLAASETSGVWVLLDSQEDAIPLSERWQNPHVTSLARVGPRHLLAGCTGESIPSATEFLYETDRSQEVPPPLLAPWLPVTLPDSVRAVHEIAVVADSTVVLATDDGIWWAVVPYPKDPWLWGQAQLSGQRDADCFSVCPGGQGSVVVGLRYPDPAAGRDPVQVGRWSAGGPSAVGSQLQMTAPTLPPGAADRMGRTVVASSPSDDYVVVYALATGTNGAPNTLLRGSVYATSASFIELSGRVPEAPSTTSRTLFDAVVVGLADGDGSAGGLIHRLAVSPVDVAQVTYGVGRAFISRDAGSTWSAIGGWAGSSPHLHADVHVVRFDPEDPQRIVIASDGGVAASPNLGADFRSYNARYPSLQMLAPDGYLKNFYGRVAVSRQVSGLAAAGLQDNGNVFIRLGIPGEAWRSVDSGDGGGCLFPESVGLLRTTMNLAIPLLSAWKPKIPGFVSAKGDLRIPVRDTTGHLISESLGTGAVCEVVAAPSYMSDGRLMCAIAWEAHRIYGLFADAVGADARWRQVAGLDLAAGEAVVVAASWDGSSVLSIVRGTAGFRSVLIPSSPGEPDDAGILGFPSAEGSPSSQLPLGVIPAQASMSLVRALGPSSYLAIARTSADAAAEGYLLSTGDGGTSWTALGRPDSPLALMELPGDVIYSVAAAQAGTYISRIFACTNEAVFSSATGRHWRRDSAGLPSMANCSHLEVVPDGQGYDIYLGTYGWSLWRARLDDPA